ncbi:MAG: class I SAM-dependent methyltransferase [Bacteroidota bacterium]
MITCPLSGSESTKVIYEQKSVPLIQNMVYPTLELAKAAKKINVTLAQSLHNGFVFSANFDDSIIDYDQHYQNEQSNSAFFQDHLRHVIQLMKTNSLLGKKIVEIGCGKAYFMNMLLDLGEDVTGFDPTYEGDSPKVIKDFFSDKYSDVGAETIVLRHTLEHISKPFDFIKTVAKANNYKGFIYIEVPTFEWIVNNNASEDVFYEHCNYFTLETLQQFFTESVGGHFFNGQYIYVIADLSKVKNELEMRTFKTYEIKFEKKLEEYTQLVSNYKNVAIWGAGAKGSTFLNLIDKEANKIKCVIDINPKKQNMFLGGTGHPIIKPEDITKNNIETIIVMNVNYLNEIKVVTDPLNIKLITL